MIVLPQIGAAGGEPGQVALAVGRAALFLALLVPTALRVVPWLVAQVAGWRSRELFVLTVVALGLGIGYLSHLAGLSYALGAFIGAGDHESEYGHQALSDIILRDLSARSSPRWGALRSPLRRPSARAGPDRPARHHGKGLIFAGIAAFGYRNGAAGQRPAPPRWRVPARPADSRQAARPGALSLTVSTALVTMAPTPHQLATVPPTSAGGAAAAQRAAACTGTAPARPVLIVSAGRVGQRVAASRRGGPPFCDHRSPPASPRLAPTAGRRFRDAAQGRYLRRGDAAPGDHPALGGGRRVVAAHADLAPGLLVARSEADGDGGAVRMGVVHVVEPESRPA
jgi:CPA2 family monovalent cation:H+ antiporter-2